jgi:secreted trypsin-like serine protease
MPDKAEVPMTILLELTQCHFFLFSSQEVENRREAAAALAPERRNTGAASETQNQQIQGDGDAARRMQSQNNEGTSDVIGYIIGGTKVTDADRYKYIVSLTKWGGHFCGGALIAPDLVVSAAHCQNIDGAKVGLINKNDNTVPTFTGISGVTRNANCAPGPQNKMIHIHKDYSDNYVNDLMIVRLGGTVDTSVYPVISINTDENSPSSGDPLTTMGWGQTIPGSSTSMPNRLNEVEVTAVSQSACKSMYGGYLQDNMFCAMDPGQDACQGDSGGPIIERGSDASSDVLMGVVSWGYGCASATHAGVYSRLSHNYRWIRDKVCCLSSDPPASFNCPGVPAPTPSSPTKAPTEGADTTTPPPIASSPTFSPKPPPIPRTTFKVCVQLDMFPNDIAFWCENTQGTKVYTYFDNLSTDQWQYKLYEHEFEVDQDELEFEKQIKCMMTDAYGDGLGMVQGENPDGAFWLVYGDDCASTDPEDLIFIGDRDFGYVYETYFETDRTCDDNDCISLEIQFDGFPSDITYSVQCGENSAPIRDHAGNYNNDIAYKNEKITETIKIPESNTENCNVTIHDKHGDGLCCAQGAGYAHVYLGSVANGTFVGGTSNSSFSDYVVPVDRFA